MKKKLTIILMVIIGILPATKVNSQVDLVGLGNSIIKWGKTMSNLSSKVQTANEMKGLIENLACAKFQFDQHRLKQSITSCIGNTNMTLLDIEYSSLYREVYSMISIMVDPAAMDDSKVSDIVSKIRVLLNKLNSLNTQAQAAFIQEEEHKAQRDFTGSVLGASF